MYDDFENYKSLRRQERQRVYGATYRRRRKTRCSPDSRVVAGVIADMLFARVKDLSTMRPLVMRLVEDGYDQDEVERVVDRMHKRSIDLDASWAA